LHFSLRVSAVAIYNDYVQENKQEDYRDDDSAAYAFILGQEIGPVRAQDCLAHERSSFKACAYGIEDSKGLKLASVSSVVNYNGRLDASPIGFPIVDFGINNGVVSLVAAPVRPCERIFNALHCMLVAHAEPFMSSP